MNIKEKARLLFGDPVDLRALLLAITYGKWTLQDARMLKEWEENHAPLVN